MTMNKPTPLAALVMLALASCQTSGDQDVCEAAKQLCGVAANLGACGHDTLPLARCVVDEQSCSASVLSRCARQPAGPSDDGGATADTSAASLSCERYLSCLLVTTPQSYAAALQLYGARSACWQSAQTAANCEQACDVSFDKISKDCSCEGTVCHEPAADTLRDACVQDVSLSGPSEVYAAERSAVDCAIQCDASTDADCSLKCLGPQLSLSHDCTRCFVQYGRCALSTCPVCKTRPTSSACQSCVDNGCTSALLTCGGLSSFGP